MVDSTKKTESQTAKFQQAARELGSDESETAFDQVLRKVGSAKPVPVASKDGKRKPKGRKGP
jgi:hypothetical protein